MENVVCTPDGTYTLKFFKAISFENLNPRADIWMLLYKLFFQEKQLTDLLWSDWHYFIPERHYLFLSNFLFNTDDPLWMNEHLMNRLYCFDLNSKTFALLSNTDRGAFSIKELSGDTLIFEKENPGVTREFEIDMGQAKWKQTEFGNFGGKNRIYI